MGREVDVAIIGAGTAGLNALAQVRKATDSYVFINGGELGTTCARVGCMPSKVLIQVAEDFHRRKHFPKMGIEGGDRLSIDIGEAMEYVRDLRDIFVDQVLSHSTDEMGEELIEDTYARFSAPGVLEVGDDSLKANKVIIATGSRPVVPEAWRSFSDRVITTDNFFELEILPESVAVIGLGVIGLEIGQALHRLGVQVTGIDMAEQIGGLSDPVVNKMAIDIIGKEFPMWLGQPAEISESGDKLRVKAGEKEVMVDRVFACMGRVPNIDRLGLENLDIELDPRGIPVHDPETMQIGDHPVFLAGDVSGHRAILHEASDEGKIAGYNAVHEPVQRFSRKTPFSITFCDPNICIVGSSRDRTDDEDVVTGELRLAGLGRALVLGKNKGMLRVYAKRSTGELLGAQMVAVKGENLAHHLAWAIEKRMTAQELSRMPFYHPTIEEALQPVLKQIMGSLDQSLIDPVPSLVMLS